ncbi:MAG: PKD domain-containing protein [Chitinophagaceae bacterium]
MGSLKNKISILSLFCILVTCKLIAQTDASALEFIENKGQWENSIRFKGVLSNGAFFLRKNGFTVVQHNPDDLARLSESVHGKPASSENTAIFEKQAKADASKPAGQDRNILRSHAYEVDFVGANENPEIIADKLQPGYNNYFIGSDSTKWAGNCRQFQSVTYKNIYPGIDVKFYSESGNLKYEFIVKPGADPSQIAMKFTGADKLSVRNSQLIIRTSIGEIKELYPYTYQYEGSQKKTLDCRYQVRGNTVKFALKNFSRSSTLIIDPILIFASFTGSTADNWGYTATYGSDGTFFAGGIVFDTGFPTSTGAYQTSYGASGAHDQSYWNMGIMKFSSNGSQRIYATYIGGKSKDQPHSLFADPQGNLVIAGRSSSDNYPSTATFGKRGGWDIVVTKLNASGTALIGSVIVAGAGDDGFNIADSHAEKPRLLMNNYGDDARSEVILDKNNNIYVASCTMSGDFFTTPTAVQKTFGGNQDAVLIKVDPNCRNVVYSTYLGGSGYDAGFVLSLNPLTQDIYMAGGTTSDNFPGNKTGTYQPTYGGGVSDGYIAVFSNDGSVLKQTTYMGTAAKDVIFGIQFDRENFPYIMGITTGAWPIVSIGNTFFTNPNSKQFISKLKKDLSGFVYSTVFGNGSATPNISPVAFLVDRCENVYVSGWGRETITGNYDLSPVAGMPVTPDALKRVPDASDFYFIVLQRDASKLLYGTFYGQNGGVGEHVDGGTSRFDQNGVIYQALCACSGGAGGPRPQWPVTPGAWCCSSGYSGSRSGAQCNLAALKISFNYAGVRAGVRAYINSVFDTTGCVPLTVTLKDTILNAQSYEWDFGDGTPGVVSDNFEVSHTYNNIGSYSVRLIAVDSATCNIRDTAHITIIVRNDRAVLDFNPVKLPPCESLAFRFDNQSTAPPGKPFTGQLFIWDFGDGTRVNAGTGSVNHTYASAGTYKVSLVLNDTSYCNGPDSIVKEIRISPLVKAQFDVPPLACAPFTAVFKNTSLAGQDFTWDFGDGSPLSNSINPSHLYANPGTYVVKLKVVDANTCNVQDSTQSTLIVQSAPTAAFTVTPTVPVENTPFVFVNASSANASRFKWIFGDGDSLLTASRSTVDHQYNATGTFDPCLVAYNQLGCTDTVCTTVKTIVVPRLDVPNAFTPLGPVQASRIFVRGFAVGKMQFTIYNRLGQKVFESTDINQGWDGRFKGVVQPMDVYTYTLEIEFIDGTRASKTGDITLIR